VPRYSACVNQFAAFVQHGSADEPLSLRKTSRFEPGWTEEARSHHCFVGLNTHFGCTAPVSRLREDWPPRIEDTQ
jgi:hypothetical protein